MLYEITYTPSAKVEAAAKARGWKDGDGSSWWDHVSDDEFCQSGGRFDNFGEAVFVARELAETDVCGEARVERIVRVHWRGAPPTWEHVAVWYVGEADNLESFFPDKPDSTNELELSDGDKILA